MSRSSGYPHIPGHTQLMDKADVVPPAAAAPGELGTVMNCSVGYEQVTAALLDLCGRGHLVITRLPADSDEGEDGMRRWELALANGADELRPHEQVLLDALNVRSGPERFPNLTNSSAGAVAAALLADGSTRGWFTFDPGRRRRATLRTVGIVVIIALILAVALGKLTGATVLAFPVMILAIGGLLVAARHRPVVRTRAGDDLAERGSAFSEALRVRPRDVDAGYFAYAVAVGKGREFARALSARGEPPPDWIAVEGDTTLTWAAVADLASKGSPYGPTIGSGMAPPGIPF